MSLFFMRLSQNAHFCQFFRTPPFNELFAAGLVMSGFVEPVAKPGDLPEEFLWAKLPEIPPAIISQWEMEK
jgi:hypothetical protein